MRANVRPMPIFQARTELYSRLDSCRYSVFVSLSLPCSLSAKSATNAITAFFFSKKNPKCPTMQNANSRIAKQATVAHFSLSSSFSQFVFIFWSYTSTRVNEKNNIFISEETTREQIDFIQSINQFKSFARFFKKKKLTLHSATQPSSRAYIQSATMTMENKKAK